MRGGGPGHLGSGSAARRAPATSGHKYGTGNGSTECPVCGALQHGETLMAPGISRRSGVWSGSLAVQRPRSDMDPTRAEGAGATRLSNPFGLAPMPFSFDVPGQGRILVADDPALQQGAPSRLRGRHETASKQSGYLRWKPYTSSKAICTVVRPDLRDRTPVSSATVGMCRHASG